MRLSALRAPFERHPVAAVWVGMLTYSTGPVIVASAAVDGPDFSIMRLMVGFPVLLVPAALTLRRSGAPPAWTHRWVVAAGLLFAVHQVTFMTAVKRTTVADVVLMNTLAPVIVMVLAVPLLGERTDRRAKWWTALAMVGGAIIAVGGAVGPQGDAVGMLLAALNVTFFAGFFLISKVLRSDVEVWPFLLEALAVSTVLVGGFLLASGRDLVPTAVPADWVLALMLAVGPGAVGHFMMTWPLARVRANVPPTIRLLQPLSAGLLAWVVLGQGVTAVQVLGGAVAIVGVLGVLRRSTQLLAEAAADPAAPTADSAVTAAPPVST